ncbi:hypothetical protein [Aquimarina sp. MMG016]|uniref:hypothetical protein n=1 Tax=Aquimarina sp. MMG016 TaxID=2822690 RepID=UPI001B3A11C1|nr:hypothetical protein [Aquimarina sp. MMG016]MBQ4820628.1 hypothetical protein [Aquimarina sp. MMG016]
MNLINTQNQKLVQSTDTNSLNYKIDTKQTIISMGNSQESLITYEVSKRFIKKDHVGYLFEVLVNKRERNTENCNQEIDDYLFKLQEKVILYTNKIGQIISIANFGEIVETWEDIKNGFRKKFKKDKDIDQVMEKMSLIMSKNDNFLTLYHKSEISALLFPPIYIDGLELPDNQVFQYKVIPYLFGMFSAPFKLLTKHLKKNSDTNLLAIGRSGFIDNSLFEKTAVQLMYREMYKSPSMNADINCNYSDMLYLNQENNIDSGYQLLDISIGEVYSFNQFSNATLLN